jgi:hypothetical protein
VGAEEEEEEVGVITIRTIPRGIRGQLARPTAPLARPIIYATPATPDTGAGLLVSVKLVLVIVATVTMQVQAFATFANEVTCFLLSGPAIAAPITVENATTLALATATNATRVTW